MRKRILEIDEKVVETFKGLGFELVDQSADEKKTEAKKPEVKKPEAKKEVAVDTSSCTTCHGANFEKSALGKSKVVKDMKKVEIEAALKGYKDGSYGGAMKAVMKPNADKLSDEQIKAIAEKFGK